MSITGYLSEFSVPEIFQFIEEGKKSGLLTIGTSQIPYSPEEQKYYVWFNQSQLLAAANELDNRGLLSLIEQRKWLNPENIAKVEQKYLQKAYLVAQSNSNNNMPMGLYLKSEGLLQAEQLKLLFYAQVIQQVGELFSLSNGWFSFKEQATPPTAEMTGLNYPSQDAILAGLRSLKDWSALQDKLPDPNSALVSIIKGKPQFQLSQVEWQVWEFTQGIVSLKDIAKQLKLSIEKVQQIAFRLIMTDLAEESTIIDTPAEKNFALKDEPNSPSSYNGFSDNNLNLPILDTRSNSGISELRSSNSLPKQNSAKDSAQKNGFFQESKVVYRGAASSPKTPSSASELQTAERSAVSQNYLQRLASFLRSKT